MIYPTQASLVISTPLHLQLSSHHFIPKNLKDQEPNEVTHLFACLLGLYGLLRVRYIIPARPLAPT